MSSILAAQTYDSSGLGNTVMNIVTALQQKVHKNTTQKSQHRTQLDNVELFSCLPVVVKDSQYEPNSPENDEPVNVTEYHHGPYQTVEDEKDLTEVKAPALVIDIVEQSVRKRSRVGHFLVSQG